MERVTGIGGVFFRTADPEATSAWYRDHLGIDPETDHPSATIRWSGGETTVWGPFISNTEYFGSRDQDFIVNYRVTDLAAMIEQLRGAGVEVVGEEEHSEYGDFGWAIDCDGRRFELWQPPACA